MSKARTILGWVWKGTAVVALTGLLVASIGKLHAGESDVVHLADVDTTGPRIFGGDAPRALAIDGDALVFLGAPDRSGRDEKTGHELGAIRVARRSEIGGARQTSSRELARLPVKGWYAFPELVVSKRAYALVLGGETGYGSGLESSPFTRIDKSTGRIDAEDAFRGARHVRAVSFGDGFVATFVRPAADGSAGAFHALVVADGEAPRTHAELERAVREVHGEAVTILADPLDGLVAVGDRIVVDVTHAEVPTPEEPEAPATSTRSSRHRLFAFPARGGERRELAEISGSESTSVKLLGASRDAVWLETTRKTGASDASQGPIVENALRLLPLREGAAPITVHQVSLAENEVMRFVRFMAGDDLVSTTCDAPWCTERRLVRFRPDGSSAVLEAPPAFASSRRTLASDAREAYVAVSGDDLHRLRLR